jgi:hypothetical protein
VELVVVEAAHACDTNTGGLADSRAFEGCGWERGGERSRRDRNGWRETVSCASESQS